MAYLSLVNLGWTFLGVPMRRSCQILGSAGGSILLWWNCAGNAFSHPPLLSAWAVGWLHVEADSLADVIKCCSLFLHRVNFSACPGGTSIFTQTAQAQENSPKGPLLGFLPRQKEHKCNFQEAEQLVSYRKLKLWVPRGQSNIRALKCYALGCLSTMADRLS